MMSIRIKLARQIFRTTNAIELEGMQFTRDDRYVCLTDGNSSWWQPVEPLFAILRTMPDYTVPDDEEADAWAYAQWCRATAPAGIFNGINLTTDTMPVPADFIDPDA